MTEIEKELNRRADIIIRQEKQIQIDAEQIRALQKQNGELTDKVKKLEKQHDIVRDERNLFQERCEDILANYYCDHKCKCVDLEKENAELNNFIIQSKKDGISPINALIIKNLENQLTKAKELLKQWLQTSKASGCDNINIVSDTEQFISEVEK